MSNSTKSLKSLNYLCSCLRKRQKFGRVVKPVSVGWHRPVAGPLLQKKMAAFIPATILWIMNIGWELWEYQRIITESSKQYLPEQQINRTIIKLWKTCWKVKNRMPSVILRGTD